MSWKITYANFEKVKDKLNEDNHIWTMQQGTILRIYQQPQTEGTYEYLSTDVQDKIIPSELNIYDTNDELLNVVLYEEIIPEGVGYKKTGEFYWENMTDHIVRRKVFDQGYVTNYMSGFISGTHHPYGNVNSTGMSSASKIPGYILWQKYELYRKIK